MHKIVTFQSPEYYELLRMGWLVVDQVSPSAVMMAHEGTVYTDRGGMPRTNDNADLWLPQFGGKPGPADTVAPTTPHIWMELFRGTSPIGELAILFKDTSHPTAAAGQNGFEYYKNEVYRAPYITIGYSQEYHNIYLDAVQDWGVRVGVATFNIWNMLEQGTIAGPGTVVKTQALIPSVIGAVQWRVNYNTGGVEVNHLYSGFTAAHADFVASGAV